MAVFGGGAVAWWLAARPATAHIPVWPAYVFAGVACVGLYGMLAPLLKWWPWSRATAAIVNTNLLPQVVVDQTVRIADLPPMVHGRTFERCEIIGPPAAMLPGTHIERSKWLGMFDRSFTVIADPTNPPAGTVAFVDCRFVESEFQNFSVVGTQEQIESIRAAFPEAHSAGRTGIRNHPRAKSKSKRA